MYNESNKDITNENDNTYIDIEVIEEIENKDDFYNPFNESNKRNEIISIKEALSDDDFYNPFTELNKTMKNEQNNVSS